MDEECKRVKLYYTSVAGTLSLKKSQIHIEDVLTAKHISFEKIDVSAPESEDKKTFMKENASGPGGKAPLPPQIFLEDEYCGDYEAFSEALEDDCLEVFLKLAKPSEVSQAEVTITGEEEEEKEDEEKIKADEDKSEKDITIEEAAEEDKEKAEKADETDSSEGKDRD